MIRAIDKSAGNKMMGQVFSWSLLTVALCNSGNTNDKALAGFSLETFIGADI